MDRLVLSLLAPLLLAASPAAAIDRGTDYEKSDFISAPAEGPANIYIYDHLGRPTTVAKKKEKKAKKDKKKKDPKKPLREKWEQRPGRRRPGSKTFQRGSTFEEDEDLEDEEAFEDEEDDGEGMDEGAVKVGDKATTGVPKKNSGGDPADSNVKFGGGAPKPQTTDTAGKAKRAR
ncbi:MAG: hypothetical protein V3S11_02315 [Elusimicrobiota bacterium]